MKQKKTRSPEKLQKELDRLNLLFQKSRIEWDYYNKEYNRIEQELKELLNTRPESVRDFSYLEDILQTDFKKMYQKLIPENQRAFWRSTVKQIYLKEDYTVKYIDFL